MSSPIDHPVSPVEVERFCKQCGYDLRGLETPRCPECGRSFDPANARTTRRSKLRRWHKHVKRVVVAMAVLLLLWVAVWTYFYIGLQREQKAVAALKLNWPEVDYVSLLSRRELYDIHTLPFAQPSAFERIAGLVLLDPRVKDLSPLANLPYLQTLHAEDTAVEDLSPLASLKRLDYIRVSGTRVRDISPLAELPRLSGLDISDTAVSSIEPLRGKTSIHYLDISGTAVTDFTPLATLVELYELKLDRTRITDTAPLLPLTHLNKLILPKETINAAQAETLRKALRCKVERL